MRRGVKKERGMGRVGCVADLRGRVSRYVQLRAESVCGGRQMRVTAVTWFSIFLVRIRFRLVVSLVALR